jgi:hypothetical protein
VGKTKEVQTKVSRARCALSVSVTKSMMFGLILQHLGTFSTGAARPESEN